VANYSFKIFSYALPVSQGTSVTHGQTDGRTTTMTLARPLLSQTLNNESCGYDGRQTYEGLLLK